MALSVFDDKTKLPQQAELVKALGPSCPLWDEIKHQLVSHFDQLTEEWVFSGKNYGWALRLKFKTRAILYLTPCKNSCIAGFALGEKAVLAIMQSSLPQHIKDQVNQLQKFAEGRAFRMPIQSMKDVHVIIQLAQIKMKN